MQLLKNLKRLWYPGTSIGRLSTCERRQPPGQAELKHSAVPAGAVPMFLPTLYYFVLILKFNKIIYKAAGDVLPTGASFRIKPQKGCKLPSESWAGSTKSFCVCLLFWHKAGGEGRGRDGSWEASLLGFVVSWLVFLNLLSLYFLGRYATVTLCVTSGYLSALWLDVVWYLL